MAFEPKRGYRTHGEQATHTSIDDFLGAHVANMCDIGIDPQRPYSSDDIRSCIVQAYEQLEKAMLNPAYIANFGKALKKFEELLDEFTTEHIEKYELAAVNQ